MASSERKFLDRVYELDEAAGVASFYDDWAKRYDAEVTENGYATPIRCSEALARVAGSTAVPVLDLGCGTGLSGVALREAGFSTIDGMDFSAEMLEVARARDGIYRSLRQTDLADPLPFKAGVYGAIAAVGVFSPNHAPPQTIDEVMRKLPRGGLFVFSLNDHALENPGYEARVADWVDCGAARVMFREHGDHLPKIGLGAVVYVLRRQ